MTELVINAPHLQSHSQRLSAFALALFGWLLWCYFFFPLVTLGCWLVDDDVCSQWVNMAGGYLNLREILGVYFHAVLAMFLLWGVWLGYDKVRRAFKPEVNPVDVVAEADLVDMFKLDPAQLRSCQTSRFSVVHYDAHGHIIGLEALGGRFD